MKTCHFLNGMNLLDSNLIIFFLCLGYPEECKVWHIVIIPTMNHSRAMFLKSHSNTIFRFSVCLLGLRPTFGRVPISFAEHHLGPIKFETLTTQFLFNNRS